MYLFFFLLNIIIYIFVLKISYLVFKNRYIFPFRIAELWCLGINLIIFIFLTNKFFSKEFIFSTIIINFCLFTITFFILSMINTSPRTKIMIDLFEKKRLNKKKYLKNYNEKTIVEKRLKRLKTNNEIIIKKNKIFINENRKAGLLKLIILIFETMKKV